jgi:hypothetical protein
MFLNFIGVNEKIVNLNAIALIEDESTDTEPVAVLTTIVVPTRRFELLTYRV